MIRPSPNPTLWVNPPFSEIPQIEERTGKNTSHVLIIPDVDPNYLKDPDSLDYVYIAQRYIWLALSYAQQDEKVILTLPDTPETQSLWNFIVNNFSHLTQYITIIFIDPKFYLPSNSISGLLPNIFQLRNNPTQPPENFFGEIPTTSKVHKIVQETQDSLSDALNWKPPQQVRTYSPHSSLILPEEVIYTSDPQIYGKEDLKQLSRLQGKKWMHPYLRDEEDSSSELIETNSSPELIKTIWKDSLPLGYFVPADDGVKWLTQAISEIINKASNSLIIIKPVLASSGEGILFAQLQPNGEIKFCYDPQCQEEVKNPQEEIFKMWDIIAEEFLDLNNWNLELGEEKIDISLVIPYTDGKVERFQDGKVLLQLTQNGHYLWGALVDSATASKLFDIDKKTLEENLEELEQKIQELINTLELKGSGAIDILITKDWRFLISDPNLGRDTGSMPLRTVKTLFKTQPAIMLNVKIPITPGTPPSSLMQLFDSFSTSNERGALAITFAQDISQAHLSVLLRGSNIEQISNLYENLSQIINSLNANYKPAATELYTLLNNPDNPAVTTIPYSKDL